MWDLETGLLDVNKQYKFAISAVGMNILKCLDTRSLEIKLANQKNTKVQTIQISLFLSKHSLDAFI